MQSNRMAAVVIVWLGVVTAGAKAQDRGISWLQDVEIAKRLAAQSQKLVLVHFWAPWCEPCKRLDREVLSRPEVISAVEASYVAVKLNADHFPASAQRYGVTSLPTDVVLTSSGQLITRTNSPMTPNAYISQISQVAALNLGAAQHGVAGLTQQGAPAGSTATAPQPVSVVNPYLSPHSGATVARTATAAPPPNNPYAKLGRDYQAPAGAAAAAAGPVGQHRATGPAGGRAGPWQAGPSPAAPATQPAPAGPRYQPPPSGPQVDPLRTQRPMPPNGSNRPAAPRPVTRQAAAAPQLGLDGYSPVTLKEEQKWVKGDRRWGAIHRGRIYLFTSSDQQRQFLENPDLYSPVLSGIDPVVAMEQGQVIAGRRHHGVFYGGYVYLFANEASLKRFSTNPEKYVSHVRQAMQLRPGHVGPK